jgi:hypothetical protein
VTAVIAAKAAFPENGGRELLPDGQMVKAF